MDLRITLPAASAWLAAVVLLAMPNLLAPAAAVGWGLCAAFGVGAGVASRFTGRRDERVGIAGPVRGRTIAVLVPVLVSLLVSLAVSAAAVALILTVAALKVDQRSPEVLVVAAESRTAVTLAVELTEILGEGPYGATATAVSLDADGMTSAAGWTALADVPVLVFDGAPASPVGIGATLEVSGQLVATEPGDDAAFLVFARQPAEVLASPGWQVEWAHQLRAAFGSVAAGLPGDGGALLPGLAIGDTSAVDAGLDSAMKTSSLSHLTAVSGANCAIIVGLVLLGGGALRLGRAWRVAIAVIVLVGFVVLVTPEASVLRAAVMAGLVLVAFARGRPSGGLPMLGSAVLVLLVLDPWMARSYGFALSVLATGGLLVLAAPLARLLARVMPLWLAAVIAVPVAAQLACQPVLVLLDPSLPTYGVVANLLAAPAAPIATVVGLAACVLAAAVPAVASVLAHLAWLPAAWIGAVARFFADLPLARVPWIGGLGGAVLLTVVTVLVLVAVLAPISRRWRRRLLVLCVLGLVAILAATGGAQLAGVLARPGNWQIAACDVGQGDAMVVRSGDAVALIDTGPEPALLAACLDTLGIGRVDLLVLTHFDLDHVGGSETIFGRVDRAVVGPPAEPADERLLDRLADAGAIVETVSRGERGLLGELSWQVLSPPARLGDVEPGNDASVAVLFEPVGRCEAGCLSSVFLGDLGERAQSRLLAANRALPTVDVVKVSHHGSADQSEALYRRLSATAGLVGVGLDNDYGHPAPSLLELLEATGTAVLRTDLDGLVLVAPDGTVGAGGVDAGDGAGGALRVWREKLAVTPDD